MLNMPLTDVARMLRCDQSFSAAGAYRSINARGADGHARTLSLVAGSFMACLDQTTMAVEVKLQMSRSHKVEIGSENDST